MQAVPDSRQNRDFQRGYPFGTRLCDAKCSVLYLLSRLVGKMRVSPDGNARFARQENGPFFANGNEKKPGGFGSGSRNMLFFYKNNCIVFHYIANGHGIGCHSRDIVCNC